MSKVLKVLDLLMSDIAVACYAAVIAVVVFAKGLPVIGGIGLGIADKAMVSDRCKSKVVWQAYLQEQSFME